MPRDHSNLVEEGAVIRDRWKILKKLGEGGFGAVFEVEDFVAKTKAALKVESVKERNQVLRMEVAVLKKIQDSKHCCKLYGCGKNEKFNYVVMSLVGKNLSDLKKEQRGQKFNISTAIRISQQCLQGIEDLHRVGFIHRDIKPSNFAIGKDPLARTVYMLDFGLARQYVNERGEPRTPRAAAGFRGTVRYASPNTHKKKEMGPHDDIWCLYYMTVEMIIAYLPWRRVSDKEEVGKMKDAIRPTDLLEGCPEELLGIHVHLTEISYPDKPNYGFLRNCEKKISKRHHVQESDPFDWEPGAREFETNREEAEQASRTTIEAFALEAKDDEEDMEEEPKVPTSVRQKQRRG